MMSTGLKTTKTPKIPKMMAKIFPISAAIFVAWARGIRWASQARSTRPPSMGNAGRRLKTKRIRLRRARYPKRKTRTPATGRIRNYGQRREDEDRGEDPEAEARHGAGEGHGELVTGVGELVLDGGDTPEDEEGDAVDPDAPPECHDAVGELVDEHADEEGEGDDGPEDVGVPALDEQARVGARYPEQAENRFAQERDIGTR